MVPLKVISICIVVIIQSDSKLFICYLNELIVSILVVSKEKNYRIVIRVDKWMSSDYVHRRSSYVVLECM